MRAPLKGTQWKDPFARAVSCLDDKVIQIRSKRANGCSRLCESVSSWKFGDLLETVFGFGRLRV
jgi:hypothetical protein